MFDSFRAVEAGGKILSFSRHVLFSNFPTALHVVAAGVGPELF